MSGYAIMTSACFGCGRIFSYNPHKVPSIRRTPQSPREPVCQDCINLVNPRRIANGLPPIVPQPDAYEAIPEEEL